MSLRQNLLGSFPKELGSNQIVSSPSECRRFIMMSVTVTWPCFKWLFSRPCLDRSSGEDGRDEPRRGVRPVGLRASGRRRARLRRGRLHDGAEAGGWGGDGLVVGAMWRPRGLHPPQPAGGERTRVPLRLLIELLIRRIRQFQFCPNVFGFSAAAKSINSNSTSMLPRNQISQRAHYYWLLQMGQAPPSLRGRANHKHLTKTGRVWKDTKMAATDVQRSVKFLVVLNALQ